MLSTCRSRASAIGGKLGDCRLGEATNKVAHGVAEHTLDVFAKGLLSDHASGRGDPAHAPDQHVFIDRLL
ncbi:MAG TPA: hypothetical protein ENJ18_12175 [Nannocystis exedens]|nr:hypothetical protein [Nannocystis exedens]